MKRIAFLGMAVLAAAGSARGETPLASGKVGWAIGSDETGSAVILHTDDSGATWEIQGDTSLWEGFAGSDISAADAETAWAALGSGDDEDGRIVHTGDGGETWMVQSLPVKVPGGMKGVKAVSREEAWAVGLRGPVLRTLDGGATWEVVPTQEIALKQVNRMDVLGQDIWIADVGSHDKGLVHSADGGKTWRQEHLPDVKPGNGPMTVTIVDSQVAWTTVNLQGDIFRTLDGGARWSRAVSDLPGFNDLDDLCAINENEVWAVQNIGGNISGLILRSSLVGSEPSTEQWKFLDYVYEGIAAFDSSTAWAVGFRSRSADSDPPGGSIRHTSDGVTWVSQRIPVDDVQLWKVSFVGACR